MMKKIIFSAIIALVSVSMFSCTKVVPIAERAKKTWTVLSASENGVVVYTKGGANNKATGYANFSLNLLSATTFTMRETDNNSFSGQYTIVGDDKKGTGTLSLKGISPIPTGTTGAIDYTIVSLAETQMVLLRSSANQKTGASSTQYTLVSQ
jgi:uncharacterized membrane protein